MPSRVLLDRSFLDALTSIVHPHHVAASDAYVDLLDRYDAAQIRLTARADVLAEIDDDVRATLLAPVERLLVAAQHRRSARRMVPDLAEVDPVVDLDHALTLVVLRRERIYSVASFDPRLVGSGVEVVPVVDAPG